MRRNILKITAVAVSVLVLAYTVQGIAAENREAEEETGRPVRPATIQEEMPDETEVTVWEPQIDTQEETQEPSGIEISEGEAEILMKVAMAESEGESTEGKALVMLVVLNRVQSSNFPDSITEVVFQKNQFSVVTDGGRYYTTTPNEDCFDALELVESGWDESRGALYFESRDGDSWHSRNLEFLYQAGGHRFYR